MRKNIDQFVDSNLDARFIITNAPGCNAFNSVMHRIAPLSRELIAVILPHDKLVNHLDSQRRTIDAELKKKSFAHAGQILAGIWSETIIDNHLVVAEYV